MKESNSKTTKRENLFLNDLQETILGQTSNSYFPIDIKVPKLTPEVNEILGEFNLPSQLQLTIKEKSVSDQLIERLLKINSNLELGYTKFVSHPGNLFVKNFTRGKLNQTKLAKFFNSNSKYKSLNEVNIFNQNSSNDEDTFAIIKFDNYLDVDYLLTKKFTSNPFHINPQLPLYVNNYISRKQRKLTMEENEDHNNYASLTIENLCNFFPKNFEWTHESMEKFFSKFELFGNIQLIYFPIEVVGTKFRPVDFGFISFEINETSNLDVLKCLYFLNELSFEEFNSFDEAKLRDIVKDLDSDTEAQLAAKNGIKISISQHKHNHYLFQFYPTLLNHSQGELVITFDDMSVHTALKNNFINNSNYQETNIYVNNFPTLFENNDELWEKFWSKFGSIKLAKIIKPQFYSKQDQSIGKIGFVFFEDFKMALRSILLTNNKSVNYNGSSYIIKTSFAIQKLNRDRNRKSIDGVVDYANETNNSPPPYCYFPQMNEMNDEGDIGDEKTPRGMNYTYGSPMPIIPIVGGNQYHAQPLYFPMPQPGMVPIIPYYNYVPNYNVYSKQ